MIATSEGTKGVGDDGYNVLVGSTKNHPLLFQGYDNHPQIFNQKMNSTAAGRYQLLGHYYTAYKKSLNLPDFSPDSQDKIALQQIKECRALDEIEAGDFNVAVTLCAHIWASLPGAGYGQHENKMNDLKRAYLDAGGSLNG